MSPQRAGQDGMALLTVMVLMAVMLTSGFAIASTVDTQTRASGVERTRDSAFNLAESALNAQIFSLSADWPGLGRNLTPYLPCTQTSGGTRCPDNAALVSGGSGDLSGATWQTSVHDNDTGPSAKFYSETTTKLLPGYDANGDGTVWVRARAVAKGRPRTLIALVRAEKQEEDLPHAALIAGRLDITNQGNQELIKAGGGIVAVRCLQPLNPATNVGTCLGHELSPPNQTQAKLLGTLASQITGTTPSSGYAGGPAMTAEARARLKATAIANGTSYAGCPTAAQLAGPTPAVAGRIVYIASGTCSYGGNTQFNAPAAPGVLVIESGSVSFGGTSNFYGVVYAANVTNSTGFGVETQGNAQITGGVLIDGNAHMIIGSSGQNLVFDLNAYRSVASYGSAGVIQNTFREIKAG